MYINKYWGKYIGNTNDTLNLVAFLENHQKEELSLSDIFAETGLDKQNWDFHQTVEHLEFACPNGRVIDFHFAISLITDLAAILLECNINASVVLHDLDVYNTSFRRICITATSEEYDALNRALADFAKSPLSYDLHTLMDDEQIEKMAGLVEALRKELYESAARNRITLDGYIVAPCRAESNPKALESTEFPANFEHIPFEGFNFTNFWNDGEYARQGYVSDPPSDELISSVEKELGYKLPASYIWLMKQHNGGIPVNTCFPTNEPTNWAADHVPITGIFGIGREKIYSLCGALGSRFMIDEWNYPAIGVAICDCPSAGHDMIFLDYRACGPHGEPAVVHVDQENDYKITHLADSFELFICGLKHESLYESDEDDTDSSVDNNYSSDSAGAHINNGEDENADSLKDSFSGFVLLSKGRWHKQQFIRDMKEKWDICVKEDDDKIDDAAVFEVDGMIAIASLMTDPIPHVEVEEHAENNYMWPRAVKAARKHRAHIMVAVLGRKENALEMGKLYTKLMAACYRQKYASGIYTSGVVFEPQFYEDFADMMKEDKLPIFNWIWFGMYRSEKGMNAYTYGLDLFDKEEMEVLDVDATPQDLRDFLASLSNYVLENDVKLRDGETIAFSATGKHTIIRSPSVSLPKDQMTLKISWGSFGGAPDRTSENDHNSE